MCLQQLKQPIEADQAPALAAAISKELHVEQIAMFKLGDNRKKNIFILVHKKLAGLSLWNGMKAALG